MTQQQFLIYAAALGILGAVLFGYLVFAIERLRDILQPKPLLVIVLIWTPVIALIWWLPDASREQDTKAFYTFLICGAVALILRYMQRNRPGA